MVWTRTRLLAESFPWFPFPDHLGGSVRLAATQQVFSGVLLRKTPGLFRQGWSVGGPDGGREISGPVAR